MSRADYSTDLEGAAYFARMEALDDDRYDGYEPDEPRRLRHGSPRACHEGDCTACAVEQDLAEREQENADTDLAWEDAV